jgi:hypothetical protein
MRRHPKIQQVTHEPANRAYSVLDQPRASPTTTCPSSAALRALLTKTSSSYRDRELLSQRGHLRAPRQYQMPSRPAVPHRSSARSPRWPRCWVAGDLQRRPRGVCGSCCRPVEETGPLRLGLQLGPRVSAATAAFRPILDHSPGTRAELAALSPWLPPGRCGSAGTACITATLAAYSLGGSYRVLFIKLRDELEAPPRPLLPPNRGLFESAQAWSAMLGSNQ